MKKRILSLCLALALALTLLPAPALAQDTSDTAVFRDIAGHWAEATITEWQQSGRTSGYSDGTFRPGSHITRAEFVTLLNRTLGLTAECAISFSDVAEKDWFYSEAAKAAAAGYAVGTRDGKFHPEASITRAEAAVMLARALTLPENTARAEAFPDASAIPAWAEGSVGAAAEAGFMTGYPSGAFGALDPITRAEAVVTLDRVLRRAQDVTITDDGTVLADETVAGDLIIAESVGEGTVTLKRVTVEGDLIIRGGGSNSVYLNDVTVKGEVRLEKENLHLHLLGGTKLGTVRALARVRISGSGTIELLIAEASGVRLDRNLTVRKTEVADGVKAPTVYNPASSGGSGGSTTSIVVTGVAPIADITVDYNTSEQDALAQLPGTMTLNCEGGSTVQAGVTWTMDEYNGAPKTTTDYTATGAVTLPAGCTYSGGTLTATATITVRGADKTIKELVVPAGIEVNYETSQTDAEARLSGEVTLRLYAGGTVFGQVSWSLRSDETYNPTTPATLIYTGTVTLPDGYIYQGKTSIETTITVLPSGVAAKPKLVTGTGYASEVYIDSYVYYGNTWQDRLKAELPDYIRLECADGSPIKVRVDRDKWTATIISTPDLSAPDTTYPFEYDLQNIDSDNLPAGYQLTDQTGVVYVSVRVKNRDNTKLQAALDNADVLLDTITNIAVVALENPDLILEVPDGTTADQVSKGVRFIEKSKIESAKKALDDLVSGTDIDDATKSQVEVDQKADEINTAVKELQEILDSAQTGSGFSQANILVNIREWLEKQSNCACHPDNQPLTPENDETATYLPYTANSIKINADGKLASVYLRWSIKDSTYAELYGEQSDNWHVRVKEDAIAQAGEPQKISLTAYAIGYTDASNNWVAFNKTNPSEGVQVEAYNNLIVGAPLVRDKNAKNPDLEPPRLTAGENGSIDVLIPFRYPSFKIEKIEIDDLKRIQVEDISGYPSGTLLSDLQVTGVNKDESLDDYDSAMRIGVKATAASLPVLVDPSADADHVAGKVKITIPKEAVTLTDWAIEQGYYIPKDGLVLEADVWVCNPAIKVDKAVRNEQDVQIWFTASYWKSCPSVRMALVPATVTEFTGTEEGSVVSKIDGRDGGIVVTGDGTYNGIHIPAADLKKDTEYIVWVKVGDGSWQNSNYSYTHQS